ncbi:MAG: hypothetical protein H6817_01185 [Phycisphaerales bacterium]|nr:hypothetical protein [Phycisphaerales bacterium]
MTPTPPYPSTRVQSRLTPLVAIAFGVFVLALLRGCESTPSNPTPTPTPTPGNNDPTARASDCLGCHTNETMLKLVARDEPPAVEESGEG